MEETLFAIKNDDSNKTFTVSFRTLPENSNGVAHVLEHTVLSGSRKFEVKDVFNEMIFTYERISSLVNKEIILCPVDYPYLYNKIEATSIFLGSTRHWRVIEESLCTFLTSKKMLLDNWEKFTSMCKFEHYPFELPLHEIYKKEYCLSPIPSLAMHCTNINSIYGLSPNINWKKIWEENKDY